MAMAEQVMDRRIARTRATLRHALNFPILKKGYEAITITDICDAANVGRSTFYAHYTSKDDLKRSGLEPLRRLLVDRQKSGEIRDRSFAFSLPMFEHARDHRDHYRALVGGRGGTVSLGTIRQILSDLVRDELAAAVKENNPQQPVIMLTAFASETDDGGFSGAVDFVVPKPISLEMLRNALAHVTAMRQ